MPLAYIGLGSNIDAEANLKTAADLLKQKYPDIRFSSVYKTEAQEFKAQDDFLNAVAMIDTNHDANTIKGALQTIERALKKTTPFRFGPRTIDLDLLLYGDDVLPSADGWMNFQKEKRGTRSQNLVLPHPRMHERRFVLEPLIELTDAKNKHPILDVSWQKLFEKVKDQDCEKTALLLY